MTMLVPEMEVSLLPVLEYHDRLKMLFRNTPSKPWIRDHDDPVQLIWASPSELRSQHSQMQYNQTEQATQKTHNKRTTSSSSINSSFVQTPTKTAVKERAHARTNKTNRKRSHNEEREVYVISPSPVEESNVFVNNKPVTLTAAENVQVQLSPKLLPSAIVGEHTESSTNSKNIDEKAQSSDDKFSHESHQHSNKSNNNMSSNDNGNIHTSSKSHNLSSESSQQSTPLASQQKRAKNESANSAAQRRAAKPNANRRANKLGRSTHNTSKKSTDLPITSAHDTYSSEDNSQESWESVHELRSPELSKERLQQYNKLSNEAGSKLETESGIEFTPSSAEVREGSVEILSSPPPVITIRQKRTKGNEKKTSSEDSKVKTRQKRASKSKSIDDDKVQLPMERFLRRM